MYISDDKLKERLSGQAPPKPKSNGEVRKLHTGGRKGGSPNMDIETKAEIGKDARVFGPTKAAKMHDVSIPRAHNLSKGITSFGNGTNTELKSKVDEKTDRVRVQAVDNMLLALGLIGDRLEDDDIKATDLSVIASNMSKVIEKTSQKDSNTAKVNVIFYSPNMNQENDYKVVEVGA